MFSLPQRKQPERRNWLAAVVALALISVWAADAAAQPGPKWDRRVKGIEVIKRDFGGPGGGGLPEHEIAVHWAIYLDDQLLITHNLSTEIELQVNGLPIDITTASVLVGPPGGFCVDAPTCGGSCGNIDIDGGIESLLCLSDGPSDCKCATPDIVWRLPGTFPLSPGDVVTAILSPEPGAEPEIEPLGDVASVTIDANDNPIYWNRSIDSVVPVQIGPDLYEITVGGTVHLNGLASFVNWEGLVPLSFDVEVLVNGITMASSPVPFLPLPIASASCPCSDPCGVYSTETLYCIMESALENCYCGWAYQELFIVTLSNPGDFVDVRLTAATGSLTENPLFDDDEYSFTCCPFGTDAEVLPTPGTGSLELAPNRPNPFLPNTTISYRIAAATTVDLEVFDVQGRRVRTLLSGVSHEGAGEFSVHWDATNDAGRTVPAGTYFCRLSADGATRTQKMTVLAR